MSAPVLAYALVVALDYGQFSLSGDPSPDADPLALLDRALEGKNLATDEYGLLVISPHQNNFAMRLAIELWDERPLVGPGRQNGSPAGVVDGSCYK